MRQLVASWVLAEEEAHGNAIGQAIERMNSALDTTTNASRVSEWRRGVYVPSAIAISYMLARTLAWAVKRSTITATDSQMDRLDALLWEMYLQDGEPHAELL